MLKKKFLFLKKKTIEFVLAYVTPRGTHGFPKKISPFGPAILRPEGTYKYCFIM